MSSESLAVVKITMDVICTSTGGEGIYGAVYCLLLLALAR